MVHVKSFLKGVLYDHFKLIYVYLNEGDKRLANIMLFEIDDASPFSGKVKHELRVTSGNMRVQIYELRVQIYKLWVQIELRVQIHDLRVPIHELRVQIYELQVKIHELGD